MLYIFGHCTLLKLTKNKKKKTDEPASGKISGVSGASDWGGVFKIVLAKSVDERGLRAVEEEARAEAGYALLPVWLPRKERPWPTFDLCFYSCYMNVCGCNSCQKPPSKPTPSALENLYALTSWAPGPRTFRGENTQLEAPPAEAT